VAIFQKPAQTAQEIEAGGPLPMDPEAVGTLDEARWYREIYRGDELPQLTARAVIMGSVLGFFLAFTNLYVGLKTGWGLGVSITACILSYAIWNTLQSLRLVRSPLSILENNCMQTTASSAGLATGGTLVSAIPALLLLTVSPENPSGTHLPWGLVAAWIIFVALMGIFMAVPMKRGLINKERLRFPSGIAAAATLQSLYSSGREAMVKARALIVSGFVAAAAPLLMDLKVRAGRGLLPASSKLFDWLPVPGSNAESGRKFLASDWLIVMDHKLLMVAAGALIGLPVSLAMVAGGFILTYVVGPAALESGAAKGAATAWRDIGVWFGAPMMVAAGLTNLLFRWRTIGRAWHKASSSSQHENVSQNHSPIAATGEPKLKVPATSSQPTSAPEDNALKALIRSVEVPRSWVAIGMALATVGLVALAQIFFAIPWFMALLAVAMTYALALVACRTTGETDINPVGPMGKIMQLTYGVLLPQNATANLMNAAITSGVASSAADLLTDLKSGYLLGANPRRQVLAQLMGVGAGTLATVTGFYLLVPDASVLIGQQGQPPAFAAPAAQAWLAVARVFQEGFEALPPLARSGIWIAVVAGVALTALERLFAQLPERAVVRQLRQLIPSASGLGLGLMIPLFYPLSMLIGALSAWAWHRLSPRTAGLLAVAIASGVIAGESIVGVVVAALNNFFFGGV